MIKINIQTTTIFDLIQLINRVINFLLKKIKNSIGAWNKKLYFKKK